MERQRITRCLVILGSALLVEASLTGCVGSSTGLGSGSGPGPGNQTVIRFESVAAGSTHGCALVNGGSAVCWGTGGDLGDGTQQDRLTPVRVESAQTFAMLDVGSYSCGVTTNDHAFCWGTNTDGRIGDGTAEYRGLPTAVLTDLQFTQITTGAIHTCAVSTGREVYCWGSNRFDQLGTHPDSISLLPIRVGAGITFKMVDAGGLRTCGIADTGDTYCWGETFGADLTRVVGPVRFASITLGGQHACGLTSEGEAFCFGSNTEGQLGDNTFVSSPLMGPPVPVQTDRRFVAISAGEFHTCAVTADGEAWCWGRDDLGQLGDGDPRPGEGQDPPKKPFPTKVRTQNTFIRFESISSGRFISCATTPNGRAFCWGFGTGSASKTFSTSAVELGS